MASFRGTFQRHGIFLSNAEIKRSCALVDNLQGAAVSSPPSEEESPAFGRRGDLRRDRTTFAKRVVVGNSSNRSRQTDSGMAKPAAVAASLCEARSSPTGRRLQIPFPVSLSTFLVFLCFC
jgi:hypothetical protein